MDSIGKRAWELAERFYLGRLYPLIICSLVLIAQTLSLEHIIIPIIVLLACGSLLTCRSVRPIIAPLCSFMYTLSANNAVFGQDSSDYYFTGWRLAAIYALAVLLVVSFAVFFIRTSFFRKLRERKTAGIIPLLVLCLAFLTGGMFSEYWKLGNIIFGAGQLAAFLFVYVLFYHGFSEDESSTDIAEYFAYICALISVVIAAELLTVYIRNDIIVNGVIDRNKIKFGWGACNTLGIVNLLLPLNFYSAYRAKRGSWIFLLTATLTYITAICSISRTALLVGTAIYLLCLLMFCVAGNRKRLFRIYAIVVICIAAISFAIFHNQLLTAFESYIDRGLTDSGRFKIWRTAWESFLKAPIFGNGFYAPMLYETPMVSFIPKMAHNTVFEFLYAMGLFGIISYTVYRLSTLLPFIKRPSIMKCSLGLMILALLASGMFDNFLFHIQPIFFYSIALSIAQRATNSTSREYL